MRHDVALQGEVIFTGARVSDTGSIDISATDGLACFDFVIDACVSGLFQGLMVIKGSKVT